jgi:hypothetical protein
MRWHASQKPAAGSPRRVQRPPPPPSPLVLQSTMLLPLPLRLGPFWRTGSLFLFSSSSSSSSNSNSNSNSNSLRRMAMKTVMNNPWQLARASVLNGAE